MSDETTTGTHDYAGGLWRWLVGGLVGGGVMLGLLVGAYAIGYNRGQDDATPAAASTPAKTAPATTTTAPATTTAPPTTTAASGPVPVTPALVARGKSLFESDGCGGCHSLTGAAGAGPSVKGTAGGTVTLEDGTTVTADDAYLERALVDPDAQIVEGYRPGIMAPAVAALDLGRKPDDVRALVAFLKSQK